VIDPKKSFYATKSRINIYFKQRIDSVVSGTLALIPQSISHNPEITFQL